MEQYSISIVANFRPSDEDNSNTRKISREKLLNIQTIHIRNIVKPKLHKNCEDSNKLNEKYYSFTECLINYYAKRDWREILLVVEAHVQFTVWASHYLRVVVRGRVASCPYNGGRQACAQNTARRHCGGTSCAGGGQCARAAGLARCVTPTSPPSYPSRSSVCFSACLFVF